MSRREAILAIFAAGRAKAAFRQRFAICCRGTPCKLFCERIVKALGKNLVFCVDIETLNKVPLYESLRRPEFECPAGWF